MKLAIIDNEGGVHEVLEGLENFNLDKPIAQSSVIGQLDEVLQELVGVEQGAISGMAQKMGHVEMEFEDHDPVGPDPEEAAERVAAAQRLVIIDETSVFRNRDLGKTKEGVFLHFSPGPNCESVEKLIMAVVEISKVYSTEKVELSERTTVKIFWKSITFGSLAKVKEIAEGLNWTLI